MSAVVDGLFRSSVEVNSQQASDRDEAFNQALVKTLLKVSGHRDLVFSTDMQNHFFPAERYVQRFSYKENPRYIAYLEYQKQLTAQTQVEAEQENITPNVSELAVTNIDDLTETIEPDLDPALFEPIPLPYLIAVDFAPKALETQMKKVNLPIWGNVRADVMFWVLVESGGERELLGNDKEHKLVDHLISLSSDYALPISFPLADDTDLRDLNMSDLWGLFPDAIDLAKQRYTANGNLMVRLYQLSENTWSANWYFSINNTAYTSQLHNAPMKMINDEIFNFLSSILAKRFSSVSSDLSTNQAMTLEVSNINSFKDYIDIQTFLEDLAPLKSFSLDWLEGSVMSLSLELNGTSEQLQEYLNLSGKLKFISSNVIEKLTEPVKIENKPNIVFESEPEMVKSFVQVEKYQWISATPKTNK
jgi:hypothetical protein